MAAALTDFPAAVAALLPRLRSFALKLKRDRDAADDLVQDTVLRALDKRDIYSEGSLISWLYCVMQNLHVDNLRAAARRGVACSADDVERHANFDGSVAVRELADDLRQLPADQRRALVLAGYGASYEETARIEHVPVTTVRTRLWRGRAALRQMH